MKLEDLTSKKKSELIEIAYKYKIDTKNKTKKQLVEELLQKYYDKKKKKYTQIKQLGKSGKRRNSISC